MLPAGTLSTCESKFLAAAAPHACGLDGLFEGYASLFGIADLGKDIVERGAFRESLVAARAGRRQAALAA